MNNTVTPGKGANGQSGTLPFAWGTREFARPIFTIPIVPGAMAAQQRVPKMGWIGVLTFRLTNASANVSAAGSAGTPNILNIINSYRLSFNGGFNYRQVDGETLGMIGEVECGGANDPVFGSPHYQNYTPTSATNQTISFAIEDSVALNMGMNIDKFLLAAHSRNADITIDVTFGSNAQVAANTETVVISGNLQIDAIFLLDPDYEKFSLPDLSSVQQWLTDVSYTNVQAGIDNILTLTPVQGPQYLQLLFKIMTGANTPDPQGLASVANRIQLQINGSEDFIDVAPSLLQYRNFKKYGRKLPAGWYVFDFLDDMGLVNAASAVARNVLSTDYIAQLNLIISINTGTTISAGAMIKVIKRLKADVGGQGG